MPVEPRGLALDRWSQIRGVPLGQPSRYGTTEAVGFDRGDRMGERLDQEDPTPREILFFETEALPEGEAGAEVSVLRSV